MQEAYVLIRHKEGSSIDTLCQRAVTRFKTVVSPDFGNVIKVFVVQTKKVSYANTHKNGEVWFVSEFRVVFTL